MNKTFTRKILCASLAGAFAAAAHAQSNITLYGVIDEGIMFQNNNEGGRRVFLDSLSGIFGSRWGMIGSEDLGGGMKAIFTIESGVNLNNGAFGQGAPRLAVRLSSV